MSQEELTLFVSRFDEFSEWLTTKQIDYLAYHLMTRPGIECFTVADIEKCFLLLDLHPYKRLAVYLSEGTSKKNGGYIKHTKGYRLARTLSDSIRTVVDSEPKRVQVAQNLADLIPKIKDSQEKSFLEEAIRAYRVEAYRASIVMIWTLAIDHLQKYTFGLFLKEFNLALASHSDKKMKEILSYDDFSELKEVRIIELMRSANIITNDVRKILDEKLGIRNSAGHPSSIAFSGHKTTEFALDLIQNILLKY
jgi:hypothetical protein